MPKRINPNRPQTKKEKYRKEAKRINKEGRSRAIAELQNEDTIYILGEDPTYIHSRAVYYNKGRETAIGLLNKGLQKVVSQVHAKINRLTPILDAEVNNIVRSLNMNSWDEFQQWWMNEVQPNSPSLSTNNEALYYLSLLEKIKKQANSIGTYLTTRKAGRAGKGGDMTQSGVKKLITAGFVDVGFTGIKGEHAGANAAITQIRNNQRKDMTELAKWIVPILEKINTDTANNIILKLKKVAGPNLDGIGGGNVDATYATDIGDMFEYISDLFNRELQNGIKVQMKNISAEKNKKLGDYIQQVDERNRDNSVTRLLGVSIEKKFIESIANTIGTDMSVYKIVKQGQFAYGPVTSRNGDKVSIALLEEKQCSKKSTGIKKEINL